MEQTRATIRLIGLPTDSHSSFLRGPAQAPGHMGQLEMAMRVDETGQEHARPDIPHLAGRCLGGRAHPPHAAVLDRDRGVTQRRPVHGHDPSRTQEHHPESSGRAPYSTRRAW